MLPAEDVRAIADAGEAQVDLAAQEVRWPGGTARFDIDPEVKHRLLNGLDDIALTLQQDAAIDAYEQRPRAHRAGDDRALTDDLPRVQVRSGIHTVEQRLQHRDTRRGDVLLEPAACSVPTAW